MKAVAAPLLRRAPSLPSVGRGGDGEACLEGVSMGNEARFQTAVSADKSTFTADEVKSIEVRAFAEGFRRGWRGAVEVLEPMLRASNEALVRQPITLEEVPGTGWHNADDARTFLTWLGRYARGAYEKGHADGSRDGARAATRVTLALLDLRGCRTAAALVRMALPSWVLE